MTPSRIAGCLAAVALLVTGGAATAASPRPSAHAATHTRATATGSMLGPNQVTTGDHVPWRLVGKGWYLTAIDLGHAGSHGLVADYQLLDLVDPLGGRYQMLKTPVARNTPGYQLSGWTPDGQVALLLRGARTARASALQVDLRYGTRHVTPLGANVASVSYGAVGSLYVTRMGGQGGQGVDRIDHDGTVTRIARATDGATLPTPDGRRLVVVPYGVHRHVLHLLDSAGHLLRTLRVPSDFCAPVRWWAPGVVLTGCGGRLYAVPVDGSGVRAVSAVHGRHSPDLGDLDARRLDGTTYLQAAGPCGYTFIARQNPDGSVTPLHVPHTTGNVEMIGTTRHRLVLEDTVSCDGGTVRAAISHFDPVTGADRVIALLPADEEYGAILRFGARYAG